ncbi:hypothetical protein HK100_000529 [Physocladia obscura]|uniref:Tetratricopeptide repeat protein 5 OB fold domain-containing protein n=1 Tax=Physocladia obscura TaxID=109957 RepID=A0AAD5T0T0_9FUNG|nr:hypothetical protein HK100_000529 [Physocladia obscura]
MGSNRKKGKGSKEKQRKDKHTVQMQGEEEKIADEIALCAETQTTAEVSAMTTPDEDAKTTIVLTPTLDLIPVQIPDQVFAPPSSPLRDTTPLRLQLNQRCIADLLPLPELQSQVQIKADKFSLEPVPSSYTTPSLDFPVFSSHLATLISRISAYRLDFSSLDLHFPLSEIEAVEASKRHNLSIVLMVKEAIAHFNALTCQPKIISRAVASAQSSLFDSGAVTYPTQIIVTVAPTLRLVTKVTPPESSISNINFSGRSSPELPKISPYAGLISCLNSPHVSFDITLIPKSRASYHLIRAKIYALLPWKDPRVEEDLGRCLKLDPTCYEAYNLMGEWYCRGGSDSSVAHRDYIDGWKLGKTCFEKGLKVQRNSEGLLLLAQVIRAQGQSQADIEESEKLCREALGMNEKNGKAWFLQDSLDYFNNAEFDEEMVHDADVYGNRAKIHQYSENYTQAIADFKKSARLDPFKTGPNNWRIIRELRELVMSVYAAVRHCQSTQAKRVKNYSLHSNNPFTDVAADLGGIKDAATDSVVGFCMKNDVHDGKFVWLQILGCLVDEGLPRAFVAVDMKGFCFGVSVFNITAPITAGDELYVRSPCISNIELQFGENKIKYVNLRIDRPSYVSVNGRLLSKRNVALTEVRFENI